MVLWAGAFIAPIPMAEGDGGVLYGLLYSMLGGVPLMATVVAFLLLFGEGFLFNHILYRCRLVSHNTFMPMLMYVVMMSCQQSSHTLTPMLVLNMVILVMLMCVLVRDVQPVLSSEAIFSFTTLFAIATMVTPKAVVLLPMVLLIVVLYKLYNMRELALCLLGFLAPYVVWVMYYFLTDGLSEAFLTLWQRVAALRIEVSATSIVDYVQVAIYGITLLLALFFRKQVRRSNLVVDNNNNAILYALFVCGGGLLFYGSLFPFSYQLFAMPYAYTVSLLFLGAGRHWLWKVLFALWAVVSVVGAYIYV